jgi:hypothetical protein
MLVPRMASLAANTSTRPLRPPIAIRGRAGSLDRGFVRLRISESLLTRTLARRGEVAPHQAPDAFVLGWLP